MIDFVVESITLNRVKLKSTDKADGVISRHNNDNVDDLLMRN